MADSKPTKRSPADSYAQFAIPLRSRCKNKQELSGVNNAVASLERCHNQLNPCEPPYHVYLREIITHLCFPTCDNIASGIHECPPTPLQSNGKSTTQRSAHRYEPHKPTQPTKGESSNAGANSGKNHGNGSNHAAPDKSKPGNGIAGSIGYFACPFYKCNPIQHLDCLLRNRLTEPSFVVQHLERCHGRQPIHCPICGQIFETHDDCNIHVRQLACEQHNFHYDGLTQNQLWKLRQNRRKLNPVDRWFCLWDIVFPGKPRPDSPYVGDPFEEIANIIRRARRAARWNFAENSLAQFLAPYAHDVVELDGIVDETERLVLNWNDLRSTLSTEGDLSYLTSDDRVPFNPEQHVQELPFSSTETGMTRHQQPDVQSQQLTFAPQSFEHLEQSSEGATSPSPLGVSEFDAFDFEQSRTQMTGWDWTHLFGEGGSSNPAKAHDDEETVFEDHGVNENDEGNDPSPS